MTLDIIQLRADLRDHTGTDEFDMPTAKADLYLNRSYWEILDKFHFREKEVTATWDTVAGTRLYNMPSPFEALRKLSIKDPATGEHKVLDRTTIDVYERTFDADSDAQGFPVAYVREGCAVRLLPTPDDAYEITQKYWTVLSDLSDSNSVPPIPQSWHEIIMFGGVWRAFLGNRDFVSANATKAHQISLINSSVPVEAKEEYDSPEARLEVRVRPYDV